MEPCLFVTNSQCVRNQFDAGNTPDPASWETPTGTTGNTSTDIQVYQRKQARKQTGKRPETLPGQKGDPPPPLGGGHPASSGNTQIAHERPSPMKSYARSSWPLPGGSLHLEIDTDRPLPKWAWERLGQLVDTLERFVADVEGNTPGAKPATRPDDPEFVGGGEQ